ncbi:MAG: 30S ribosome-binding factor RbfA [Lachnospiraceae bacterium]|nr:30S ribosome-binding factor RbfA [Lachnospiraceae bacterium]MBR2530014.1 30S ribosome-binding factor RbfA [Lachnospiraceae bacterium]
MRKNSIKNTRINAEVQKELANLIRGEIKDPRIAPMTCVTDVEVAPDLKTCKVYISVLGDDEARRQTMEGLERAEGFLRHQLAETLNLRNTPTLRFIPDTSTEYGMAMSAKIDEVMAPIHERDNE